MKRTSRGLEIFIEAHLDYDGALAELEVARRSLPNDARVFATDGCPSKGVRGAGKSPFETSNGQLSSTRATLPRSSSPELVTQSFDVMLNKNRSWIAY